MNKSSSRKSDRDSNNEEHVQRHFRYVHAGHHRQKSRMPQVTIFSFSMQMFVNFLKDDVFPQILTLTYSDLTQSIVP